MTALRTYHIDGVDHLVNESRESRFSDEPGIVRNRSWLVQPGDIVRRQLFEEDAVRREVPIGIVVWVNEGDCRSNRAVGVLWSGGGE